MLSEVCIPSGSLIGHSGKDVRCNLVAEYFFSAFLMFSVGFCATDRSIYSVFISSDQYQSVSAGSNGLVHLPCWF